MELQPGGEGSYNLGTVHVGSCYMATNNYADIVNGSSGEHTAAAAAAVDEATADTAAGSRNGSAPSWQVFAKCTDALKHGLQCLWAEEYWDDGDDAAGLRYGLASGSNFDKAHLKLVPYSPQFAAMIVVGAFGII